ncbi:MAG TPA: DEAD/DEAH box helicase [Chloroflexota bacterium]|nr:DEAD/DEAH box helicase [Chloroflexota bacterium]
MTPERDESEAPPPPDAEAEPEGFREFGLHPAVLRALDDLGYEAPTPVQQATIRLLLEGRDVIAQAQTGTGKTAAYGIPIVERTDPALRRPQALVLAPTRELAVQVAEALHQLGRHRGMIVLPVYGGQAMDRQLRGLRAGVHVVVGTPGRLLDHLRRGTLDLSHVTHTVLDEADEMLDMGFLEDVEAILAAVEEAGSGPAGALETGVEGGPGGVGAPGSGAARGPGAGESDAETRAEPEGPEEDQEAPGAGGETPSAPGRALQRTMFSATMPAPVERLARRYLRDAVRITIDPQRVTVPQIEQVAYEVGGTDKLDALARILDVETPGSAIVFCGTRRMVDDVADRLQVRGYRAAPLHGDMAQAERERVLRRFRDGQTEVLVATDVAARGLDIEGVTHVVNFDVPWDPEQYVHRIGRTGRAGRTGDAITLVTPRDYRLLRTIERLLGNRVERKRLPSLADLAARRREATKEAVTATVAGGGLDPYLVLAGELGDDHDPVEVAAAALRLWDEARTGAQEETTLAGVLRAAAAEEQALQARRSASEAEAGGQAPEAGMRRIFVAAGRADGLRPQDLVGAIANETGLPGRAVGAIDILDRFSFVEVPSREALRVVDALKGTTLRGRRVGAHLADESDERGGRGGWVQRDDRGRWQRDERGPRPRDGAGPGPRGGPPDRDARRPPGRDSGRDAGRDFGREGRPAPPRPRPASRYDTPPAPRPRPGRPTSRIRRRPRSDDD